MPSQRHGLSLFIRVATFVFVAMATTVSTLTGISYFAAQRIIRQQVEQRLSLAARQRSNAIGMYIRQQHERVRLISGGTRLRHQFQAWTKGEISTEEFRSETEILLTDAMTGSEDIQEIWLADAVGKVVAATNPARIEADVSANENFLAGRQAPFLSEFRRDDQQLMTWLSGPALDANGNLLGVVQVVIRATQLIDLISNQVGLGRTGEVLVGKLEGGDEIRYLLPSRMTHEESVHRDKVPTMVKAIQGEHGFELASYADQDVLIAYDGVPLQSGMTDWGLVVKIATAEAFTPLTNLRRVLVPLGLLLLIPAIISAYWLANRYARPIMHLAKSADILARGNLKHRVPVTDDDEIGVMSKAFNDMASQLEASYEALEQRVEERTQALSRANRDLERSNRDLEQFAYVASHDLQEPLRAIAGFANILQDQCVGELSPDAREYLRFVSEAADRMKLLIDNLLEYSRVRSMGAPFERIDSRKVLQGALDNLRSTIEESQASITFSGLGDVLADSSQLTQVFQNLIGNAVKFYDKRPPRVRIEASYGADQVTFSVSDKGIGIEPGDFGRIFTIFRRLHARDAYTGTGIGLALCQQIVQRHGGRIWVESELGHGSTFYFTLPLPPDDA